MLNASRAGAQMTTRYFSGILFESERDILRALHQNIIGFLGLRTVWEKVLDYGVEVESGGDDIGGRIFLMWLSLEECHSTVNQ